MLGYLQLLRPANCIMTALAVFIGGLLVLESRPEGLLTLGTGMLAAFLVTGAGNAINDYIDVETDKVNRPRRPIPAGRVSRRGALAFSVMLFVLGIFLAGLINWVTFFIALINSILLVVYSTHLQDKLLIGNIAISYLVGSGFLFGGAVLGNIVLPAWLFLLAGLANMSREIVKDLEDVEGDRRGLLKRLTFKAKKRIYSIADRFGIASGTVQLRCRGKLAAIAAVSLVLAVAVSPLPYMMGMLRLSYLFVLVPTNIIFLMAVLGLAKAKSRKGYGRVSRLIKIGMLLGLVAFIVGVLF